MRIMAIDLGNRRIGVAVSDPDGILAQGIATIQHRSRRADAATLAALAQEQEAGKIVLGYPLLLSGRPGEQAQAAKRFGQELARHTDLPIVYWDERLSTVAAHRLMREAGIPSRRQAERIDAAAAELILQNYLDWCRRNERINESTN